MNHAGARALTVLLLVAGAGCGVGEEGGGASGLDGTSDDRDETLGIVCNATYDLAGTFTPGAPTRPAAIPTGCWPVGTWTFTATLDTNECGAPPAQLTTTYAFRVDRAVSSDPTMDIGWEETYTWLGDEAILYRLKVSEGGGGDCEGGLELYSPDGTEYWNLKPALLDTGNALSGFAEYAKYRTDQR